MTWFCNVGAVISGWVWHQTITNILEKAERCKLNNINLSYGLGKFSTEKDGLGEVSYRIIMTVFNFKMLRLRRTFRQEHVGFLCAFLIDSTIGMLILSRRFQRYREIVSTGTCKNGSKQNRQLQTALDLLRIYIRLYGVSTEIWSSG